MTAIRMEPIGEYYSKTRTVERLEAGQVVIIAGGTGNPFFTTDTASSLRSIEVEADVMLKGTRVDGIYTADPEKDPSAVKFDEITFDEIYRRNLKVMDLTATTMCKENVYGDGAFKDPVCGIWELADPVVSPGYTDGLKGTPSEVKFKMIADNAQGDAEEAVRSAIRSKPAASERDSGLAEEKNALGTTLRRYTDLLGSLCDLVSASFHCRPCLMI